MASAKQKAWRKKFGQMAKAKSKSPTKKRRSSMGRRKTAKRYYRRSRGLLSNKYVLGAVLAVGATMAARQFKVNPIYAKIGMGIATNNPILAGYGFGQLIQSGTFGFGGNGGTAIGGAY